MLRIFNIFPQKLLRYVMSSSSRSKEAVRNIAISFSAKAISILSNLLVVPLTIHYVNPTRYGIWLTISSIIGWIAFFDLGLGNGFRNKFSEARAKGDMLLARKYLSTTYFTLGAIIGVLYIVIFVVNQFINWPSLLHIDSAYYYELRDVFSILSLFFCMNMVFNIFGTMLTADQKIGLSSMIVGLGQLFSLVAIFVLTRTSEGSLIHLATYYSGVPCIIMLLASLYGFTSTRYREIRPGFKYVDLSLVKNILNLGIQFFVIYLCLLLIFQVMNIVITRELGPDEATRYNLAFKYFNILHMGMMIIISPFWSAFTDAYTKKDYAWMRSIVTKLELCWVVCVTAGAIMLFLAPWFYHIWIGDDVVVGRVLSACVLFYILSQIIGAIYMQMINGIGTVRIQMILYIAFAAVSFPLMVYSCRMLGVAGIIVIPSIVYILQAIIGKIQLRKLMSQTASGIWYK